MAEGSRELPPSLGLPRAWQPLLQWDRAAPWAGAALWHQEPAPQARCCQCSVCDPHHKVMPVTERDFDHTDSPFDLVPRCIPCRIIFRALFSLGFLHCLLLQYLSTREFHLRVGFQNRSKFSIGLFFQNPACLMLSEHWKVWSEPPLGTPDLRFSYLPYSSCSW